MNPLRNNNKTYQELHPLEHLHNTVDNNPSDESPNQTTPLTAIGYRSLGLNIPKPEKIAKQGLQTLFDLPMKEMKLMVGDTPVSLRVCETSFPNFPVAHGTIVKHIPNLQLGPKNIGKGAGGSGLYLVAEEELYVAKYYSKVTHQNLPRSAAADWKTPAVVYGQLNPNKTFKICSFELQPPHLSQDLSKGIFGFSWAKQYPEVLHHLRENFDMIIVRGSKSGGNRVPSDAFLVINERAGKSAVKWRKFEVLKGVDFLRGQLEFGGKLGSPIDWPMIKNVAHKTFRAGKNALIGLAFLHEIRTAIKEQPQELPKDVRIGRGFLEGLVNFVSNTLLFHIAPSTAFMDIKKEIDYLSNKDKNKTLPSNYLTPTNGFIATNVNHCAIPEEYFKLELKFAKKWETQKQKIVDYFVHLFDRFCITDTKVTDKMTGALISEVGKDIKIPEDFFNWSTQEQMEWKNSLIEKAEKIVSTVAQSFLEDEIKTEEANEPTEQLHDSTSFRYAPWENLLPDHSGIELANDEQSMENKELKVLAEGEVVDNTPKTFLNTYPLLASQEAEATTPPTYGELFKVNSTQLNAGSQGGYGLSVNQESGAKIGIYTDGKNKTLELTTALDKSALNSLKTGLPAIAPIAGAMLIYNYFNKKSEKNQAHEKAEKKSKEIQEKINSTENELDDFQLLLTQFSNGTIDKEKLLDETSKITTAIDKEINNYKEKSNKANKNSTSSYYFNVARAFKNIKEVIDQHLEGALIASNCVKMPLTQLNENFHYLSSKKSLTSSQSLFLNAVIKEIYFRMEKGENIFTTDQLISLQNILLPNTRNPANIELPPKPHSAQNFEDDSHTSRLRKAKRVWNWHENLTKEVSKFVEIAKQNSPLIEDLETLQKNILDLIEKNEKRDYKLCEKGKKPWSVNEHYGPFTDDIKTMMTNTINSLELNNSSLLFSNDEYNTLNFIQHLNAYTIRSIDFNKSQNINEKNDVFSSLVLSAQDLEKSINKLNESNENDYAVLVQEIRSIIELSKTYPTYSDYTDSIERANFIHSSVQTLIEETNHFNNEESDQNEKKLDLNKRNTAFANASKAAKELIKSKVTLQELENIILIDKPIANDSKQIFSHQDILKLIREVNEIADNYPSYNHYQEAIARDQQVTESLSEYFKFAAIFNDENATLSNRDEAFKEASSTVAKLKQLNIDLKDLNNLVTFNPLDKSAEATTQIPQQQILNDFETIFTIHKQFRKYSYYLEILDFYKTRDLANCAVGKKPSQEEKNNALDHLDKAKNIGNKILVRLKREILPSKSESEAIRAISDLLAYYRSEEYARGIIPVYTAPTIQVFSHVLNDFSNRFQWGSKLKPAAKIVSIINNYAPGVLATGLAAVPATFHNELPIIGNLLAKKVKTLFPKPQKLLFRPTTLHKAAISIEQGAALIQLATKVLVEATSKVYGANSSAARYTHLMDKDLEITTRAISNTISFLSLVNKTWKYSLLGLGDKFHKVGRSYAAVATTMINLWDFLARDLPLKNFEECSYSEIASYKVKKMINETTNNCFLGQLPESDAINASPDLLGTLLLSTSGICILKNSGNLKLRQYESQASIALAAACALTTGWNWLTGRYEDDTLANILTNYAYNKSCHNSKAMEESIENLKTHLKETYLISSSDSIMKAKAKTFYFENALEYLKENEHYQEIVDRTEIEFSDNFKSCKFKHANMEVWDSFQSLYLRCEALFKIGAQESDVQVLESMIQYFNHKWSEFSPEEQSLNADFYKSLITNANNLKQLMHNSFQHDRLRKDIHEALNNNDMEALIQLTSLSVDNQEIQQEHLNHEPMQAPESFKFSHYDFEVDDAMEEFFIRYDAIANSLLKETSSINVQSIIAELDLALLYFKKKIPNEANNFYLISPSKVIRKKISSCKEKITLGASIHKALAIKDYDSIIDMTTLTFEKKSGNCKFEKFDLEISDAINEFLRRDDAIASKMMIDAKYCFDHIKASIKELSMSFKFLKRRVIDRSFLKEIKKVINNKKARLLDIYYNHFICESEETRSHTSKEFSKIFNRIPKENHTHFHWMMLAITTLSSKKTFLENPTNHSSAEFTETLNQFDSLLFLSCKRVLKLIEEKKNHSELTEYERNMELRAFQTLQQLPPILTEDSDNLDVSLLTKNLFKKSFTNHPQGVGTLEAVETSSKEMVSS